MKETLMANKCTAFGCTDWVIDSIIAHHFALFQHDSFSLHSLMFTAFNVFRFLFAFVVLLYMFMMLQDKSLLCNSYIVSLILSSRVIDQCFSSTYIVPLRSKLRCVIIIFNGNFFYFSPTLVFDSLFSCACVWVP